MGWVVTSCFRGPGHHLGSFPLAPQCGISSFDPCVPGSTLPVVGWPVSGSGGCGWGLVGEPKDCLGPRQGKVRVGMWGYLEPSILGLHQLRWGWGPESMKGVPAQPDCTLTGREAQQVEGPGSRRQCLTEPWD